MTIQFDGTTGVSSVGSLTVNGDLAVSGSINSTNTFGFKNRIINGAMVIDQRNAGASIMSADSAYSLDRWKLAANPAAKYTVQQNAGSVTPPVGFVNYLGVTSSSSYSVGAGEYQGIQQRIEGFNVADLGWGTANAAPITISFWVRSSLTGTFGGSLYNANVNRSYPFTYTISASNTWEQKTLTVAGDTSGTWTMGTFAGLTITLGLGVGSTYSGTTGSWAGALYFSATGAVSVVGTSGATFYITGVQLEKGSVSTNFDFRSYSTELALCQRYYYKMAIPSAKAFANGNAFSTTQAQGFVSFPVTMRASPTALEQSGTATDYRILDGATFIVCSAAPAFGGATNQFGSMATFTVASGLTVGRADQLYAAIVTTAFLAWSAEL